MSKQNFSKEDIEYRAYKFFEEKGVEYADNIDELIEACRDFAYPLVSYFRKENRKLEKENAELKQQIEKMKCGQNCKHLYINLCDLNFRTCSNCKDRWEIKE